VTDWRRESRMFDQMAGYYDRFRPGYPAGLVDALVEEAGLEAGSRILEAGAGSGKATGQLAGRGCRVTCVEPGPALCRAGRARFAGRSVEFVETVFEEYRPPPGAFRLVFSAQAWHWVRQPEGCQVAARALAPGGFLGVMYNLALRPEGEAGWELARLHGLYGTGDRLDPPACEARIGALTDQTEQSGLFERPRIFREPWRCAYDAESLFGLALTGNAFVQRSGADKEAARREMGRLAERLGGKIEQPYLGFLALARRT